MAQPGLDRWAWRIRLLPHPESVATVGALELLFATSPPIALSNPTGFAVRSDCYGLSAAVTWFGRCLLPPVLKPCQHHLNLRFTTLHLVRIEPPVDPKKLVGERVEDTRAGGSRRVGRWGSDPLCLSASAALQCAYAGLRTKRKTGSNMHFATSPSDRRFQSFRLSSKELSKACSSADEGLVVATGALSESAARRPGVEHDVVSGWPH